MTSDFIPVNSPDITQEDKDYVGLALSQGWISGEGPFITEFEELFASVVGRDFGISVSNGSVAIDLVIEALGLGPGDEVILPSFTIISCLSQILRSGATPIFVDACETTWNMKVDEVANSITSQTKAIIAVHIYGLPVDMDPLIELAKSQNIFLIEDAAEAHGLKYKDKNAGSMGDVSTFSFYANKNVTTGEGGMILTDDPLFAAKIKTLKNLGFKSSPRFVHDVLGWNSRLGSLQAALGTSQTRRLDSIVEKRKRLGSTYQEAFKHLESIKLPATSTSYAENNYWVFGIVLNPDYGRDALDVSHVLGTRGIGTRPFFYPLHKQPVLKSFGFEQQPRLAVSEMLGKQGFYIPNGLGMSSFEVERVIEVVLDVLD